MYGNYWLAKNVALFLNSARLLFFSSSSRLLSSCSCLISSSNLLARVCSSICQENKIVTITFLLLWKHLYLFCWVLFISSLILLNWTHSVIILFIYFVKMNGNAPMCIFILPLSQRSWPHLLLLLYPHPPRLVVCRSHTNHCLGSIHQPLPSGISAWTETQLTKCYHSPSTTTGFINDEIISQQLLSFFIHGKGTCTYFTYIHGKGTLTIFCNKTNCIV